MLEVLPMSDIRSQLLKYFQKIQALSETGPLKDAQFAFPRIDEQQGRAIVGRKLSDTTRSLELTGQTKRNAAERLSVAASEVTKKRQFGRTPLHEWQDNLTFAGDKAVRISANERYRIQRSTANRWDNGDPINLSAAVADDWFLNTLLPRIRAGAEYRHSAAVVGNPGCGKSTLLKFLIIRHIETTRREGIVFSRFEFLKFWTQWRSSSPDALDNIGNYLSFINLRDLVIHHLLTFRDGIPSERRFEVSQDAWLKKRIDEICDQARYLAGSLSFEIDFAKEALVRQVLEEATHGNERLMAAVRLVPQKLRVLMIGVLSNNLKLVTIFDGLDSVRIEDAFVDTDQFKAVRRIISARRYITQFEELSQAGVVMTVDSVTVMRSNTAAFINLDVEQSEADAQFIDYFELAPVDAKAALAGAAYRSANLLEELKGKPAEVESYVFGLMTILKRTMLAISRGYGTEMPYQLVFGLFDGNLRELFAFLEIVVNWQTREMISGHYLESAVYMGNSVLPLVRALSSERGTELLLKKSYRIVELLLLNEGDRFENAISVKWTSDPLLSDDGKTVIKLTDNPKFAGHVDNVFNYLRSFSQSDLDQHGLLEKIRVIQLCESRSLTTLQVHQQLDEKFGYAASNIKTTIQFLLKTNCLYAVIETQEGHSRVVLRATNRALLCIKALIFNLSYLEHIFHKTLLPECLIRDIKDRPRSADVTGWVAASVRNAFILVSYVNFVENHRAGGKEVPAEFRIAEKMRKGINSAIERMTSSGSPEPARSPGSGGPSIPSITAEMVCKGSSAEIAKLITRWKHEKVTTERP
jgi:hypothetical protein